MGRRHQTAATAFSLEKLSSIRLLFSHLKVLSEVHTDLEGHETPWMSRAWSELRAKEMRLLLWHILLILDQNNYWVCCGTILEKQSRTVLCDRSFPCLKLTAASRGCCRSTLGYSQPQGTIGLLTWAGGTYSQDCCYWHWQHCRILHLFKMGSFKARISQIIYKSWKISDYQPKSIKQNC